MLRTIKNQKQIRVWWAKKANRVIKVKNNWLLQEVQHLEETAYRTKRKQNPKSQRNKTSHKLKAVKVTMFLRTTRIVVRLSQAHNQAPVQGLEAAVVHQVVALDPEQQAATLLLVRKYPRPWHIRASWLHLATRVQALRSPNQRAHPQNLNPWHKHLCLNRSRCPNHRVWWQVARTRRIKTSRNWTTRWRAKIPQRKSDFFL